MDFSTFSANNNNGNANKDQAPQTPPQPQERQLHHQSTSLYATGDVSFAAFAEEDIRRRKEIGQKKYEDRRRLGGIAYETSLYAGVPSTTRKHHHHGGKDRRRHSHRTDSRNVMQFTEAGRSCASTGSDITFVAARSASHHLAGVCDSILEDAQSMGNAGHHRGLQSSPPALPQFTPSLATTITSATPPPSTSDPSPEFTEASHLINVLGRSSSSSTNQHQYMYGYIAPTSSYNGGKYRNPEEAFVEYSRVYAEQQQKWNASHHQRHRRRPSVQQHGPPAVAVARGGNITDEVSTITLTTKVAEDDDDDVANQQPDATQTHSAVAISTASLVQTEVGEGVDHDEDNTTPSVPNNSNLPTISKRDVLLPVAAAGDGVLSLIKGNCARLSNRGRKRGGKRHRSHTSHNPPSTPSPSAESDFLDFRESSGANALDLYVASCEDAQLRHHLRSLNADISAQSTTDPTPSANTTLDRPPLTFASPTSHSRTGNQQLPDPWSHKAPLQFVLSSRNGRTNRQL
jgi:hypothetical protein